MQRLITILFCFAVPFVSEQSFAQQPSFKRIKKKTEQKVEQTTADKISEEVNHGIDQGIERAKSIFKNNKESDYGGNESIPGSVTDTTPSKSMKQPGEGTDFGVYSKFTFVPGNKILFYDDFEQDGLGDFPVKWESSGSGEVITNSRYPGKWLSISGRSGYYPVTGELPENYTIEFDVVTNGFQNNNSGNAFTLAFIKKKSYNMGSAGGHAHLRISLHQSARMEAGNTGAEKTPRISSKLNQKFSLDTLVHFSVAVNKNRLRIWMEEEKLVDMPSLLVGNMGRHLLFEAYEIHPGKGHTVLLSNFKVAEANEDLRSQLLNKGRFSTTGIYFNTDKADIKPESYAVIKSVAEYLKENPAVKIQIIGHTDALGEDQYNQQLSEKRANAVVQSLVRHFAIQESRLIAAGKGETEPVEDNATEKGRANNRRVEFVKI